MASVSSLDKDLARLRRSKYTPEAAASVSTWISSCLGEPLPAGDLMDVLKDGTILCRLVNLLGVKQIKPKKSAMPFVQMENISQFLTLISGPPVSLPPHDRFLTVDLFEKKDPAQVLQCLGAFSRIAHNINPAAFTTTVGGLKSNVISPQNTGAGSKSPPPTKNVKVSAWTKPEQEGNTAPAWNVAQYGYMGGASQGNQGITFGGRRQITGAPAGGSKALPEQENERRKKVEVEDRERLRTQELEESRNEEGVRAKKAAESERERQRTIADAEKKRVQEEAARKERADAEKEKLRQMERELEEESARQALRRHEQELEEEASRKEEAIRTAAALRRQKENEMQRLRELEIRQQEEDAERLRLSEFQARQRDVEFQRIRELEIRQQEEDAERLRVSELQERQREEQRRWDAEEEERNTWRAERDQHRLKDAARGAEEERYRGQDAELMRERERVRQLERELEKARERERLYEAEREARRREDVEKMRNHAAEVMRHRTDEKMYRGNIDRESAELEEERRFLQGAWARDMIATPPITEPTDSRPSSLSKPPRALPSTPRKLPPPPVQTLRRNSWDLNSLKEQGNWERGDDQTPLESPDQEQIRWSNMSFLERERERERQRQKEWERDQEETNRRSMMSATDEHAGWSEAQYGYADDILDLY